MDGEESVGVISTVQSEYDYEMKTSCEIRA